MTSTTSLAELAARAKALDESDPLRSFREKFAMPRTTIDGQERDQVYLCGNSLGLMPKAARTYLEEECDAWSALAVDGHFEGKRPWYRYHEFFTESAAKIVGAKPVEVVMMNSLTTNLHLMMTSFYRPTKERYKIVIEHSAFPSDRFAFQSQAKLHGFDPSDTIVAIEPREGEDTLRTEDIESYLDEHGESVALVLFGGVNYYTGQRYELGRITAAAHRAGAKCGFDLAHAAGNVPLSLHNDGPDFAVFCTYKYLNAGPGSVGGCFVHERHAHDDTLPRFAGWWGTDPATRFEMGETFEPYRGAEGWQLSNAPVLAMAALRASFDLFDEATMEALRTKSEQLTTFLLDGLGALIEGDDAKIDVITPRDVEHRGCQLSLRVHNDAAALQKQLQANGVVSDFRRPDVVRIATVPLYNSFADVADFVSILRRQLDNA